jgi:hypothetical protein
MQSDPGWSEPSEVHVTRVDVPFLELTWFFVKASLAMALAFSVTSWLWVVIGTGVIALSAGLLLLLGVPGWFATAPSAVTVARPQRPSRSRSSRTSPPRRSIRTRPRPRR